VRETLRGSWSACSSERNWGLSMNLRTQHTSSQRDEGHLTGPIPNSGGPCRAATGQSHPGSWSACSSERNWGLPMNRWNFLGRATSPRAPYSRIGALGDRALPARPGSWSVCGSERNWGLSMNLRTQHTSSQRGEDHLTGPIATSGGPDRTPNSAGRRPPTRRESRPTLPPSHFPLPLLVNHGPVKWRAFAG
jgi:hypothetical protein